MEKKKEKTAKRGKYRPPRSDPPVQKRGLYTLLSLVVLISACCFLLQGTVFRIKEVKVSGVVNRTQTEVVAAAGISGNMNYFSINEQDIKQGINANRYFVYQGLERLFPDKLLIYVKERVPCANVLSMGSLYILDDEGMVLEKSNNITPANQLAVVTGMQFRDIRVGSQAVCNQSGQMSAYVSLMYELSEQGFSKNVSELNFSDLDNIYLVTTDGYTVYLGNQDQLRAKVGTMRAVISALQQNGLSGGTIEAGNPGTATYRPSDL